MFMAKDVMTFNVVSVRPDATLNEVAALLLRHRVSGMPVADAEGELLGVITEYDLLPMVYDPELSDGLVMDHMTQNPIVLSETDALVEVADRFISTRMRRLLVVQDGKLKGVISRHDLIRFIRETRQRVAKAIARQSQSSDNQKPASKKRPTLTTQDA